MHVETVLFSKGSSSTTNSVLFVLVVIRFFKNSLRLCQYGTDLNYLRQRRLFLVRSLCLFVCPSDNWKSCERILTKFLGGVGHGPGTNGFNFGDDPDHRPDPGVRSPKSAFTGLSKNLPTDFNDILWRAGVWPRDQLITFWWQSALLSGSGNPFRILKSGFTGLSKLLKDFDEILICPILHTRHCTVCQKVSSVLCGFCG